jgi:hypothetical protein
MLEILLVTACWTNYIVLRFEQKKRIPIEKVAGIRLFISCCRRQSVSLLLIYAKSDQAMWLRKNRSSIEEVMHET